MEESKGSLNPDAHDFTPKVSSEVPKSGLNTNAATFEPEPIIEAYETQSVPNVKAAEKFEGRYGLLNFISAESFVTYDATEDSWVTYNEWTSKSKLPEGKHSRAVMTSPTSFVVSGGYNGSALKHSHHVEISKNFGEVVNSISVYEMHEARFLHSTVLFNNTVFILAGQSNNKTYLNSVEAFENGEWVMKAGLNKPRSYCTAVCNNSAIWVAGGFCGQSEVSQSVEKYVNGSWQLIEVSFPMLAGMASVPRDRFNTSFFILGGSDGNTISDRVLVFNTESSGFEGESNKLLVPRAGAVTCWFGNSYWVIGGGHSTGEFWTQGVGKETKVMPLTIYSQLEASTFMKSRD